MTEIRTTDTLAHAVVPAVKICASLVRIDSIASGALDNSKHWEVLALLYPDLSSGIKSLAGDFMVFDHVAADYSVPQFQKTRRGFMYVPRRWQRDNTERHVSGFFTDAQPETRVFLSKLLIAKGAKKGLSLAGLRRGTGINWGEYTREHADEYRRLAQELLVECGIDGNGLKIHEVDLEKAIEGYLAHKTREKVAA